jgi:hypothetical protein
MAAPTNAANVKKAVANTEPSTHDTLRTFGNVCCSVAIGGKRTLKNHHLMGWMD